MQINLNPTSARGASRDAVNRPRETLGDSHLISSDPRSRFGLVCDLLCCRGNICSRTRTVAELWPFYELSVIRVRRLPVWTESSGTHRKPSQPLSALCVGTVTNRNRSAGCTFPKAMESCAAWGFPR